MHPHPLHALAAAASLTRALEALEAAARGWADADHTLTREVSIPSQVFGRRTSLGGHGDPTADLALGAWAPGNPNPHAAFLGSMMRELDDLVVHVRGAPGQDPLGRLRQAIPGMSPRVAGRLAEALTHLDGTVRERIGLPPDLTPVSGQCPACRSRGVLYVTTGRLLVCRATGCTCAGDGCPCSMPVRVEGVGHIWTATHPLVTAALAAVPPTITRED
ncbi:hypothetical protein ACIBBG_33985 [Micromonospora chersina]|uniref:hypothetical protein n=1 Tax=Micromonospora chersina TaxID=47854 RepID=UPI00378BB532